MPLTPHALLRRARGPAARAWAAVLGATALGACANAPPSASMQGPTACRLLARSADVDADAQTLAARVAQAAGVAVRAEPAAPAGWWLLHLATNDAADCERARQQLATVQPPLFLELHADARRNSPPRPRGPSTR